MSEETRAERPTGRLDRAGASDPPAAGSGPIGPADPVEERYGDRPAQGPVDAADLDALTAHYAGVPPEQEAAQTPPTSSARHPASSEPTGATRPGSRVTGRDQGPSSGIDD